MEQEEKSRNSSCFFTLLHPVAGPQLPQTLQSPPPPSPAFVHPQIASLCGHPVSISKVQIGTNKDTPSENNPEMLAKCRTVGEGNGLGVLAMGSSPQTLPYLPQ